MPKYICTCPDCNADFAVVTENGEAANCPACSCEVKLETAKVDETEESGGCSGCAGCSGC